MCERRWVIRDHLSNLAVAHPEIFHDIGGILSGDQANAVRDICAVLSDWRQAANVMQSDHPEFWGVSAFFPSMMTLKAGMERSHYKVLSAADPKVKIASWPGSRCTQSPSVCLQG